MSEPRVTLELSVEDAQGLYDHTGTMPHNPDGWTHRVRQTLSEQIHVARLARTGGALPNPVSPPGTPTTGSALVQRANELRARADRVLSEPMVDEYEYDSNYWSQEFVLALARDEVALPVGAPAEGPA